MKEVYDYRGTTVVLETDISTTAFLVTGTVGDPYDFEVGTYPTKAEAKAAAEEMVDEEIKAEMAWEKRIGLYEYDPRDDDPTEI